MEVTHVQDHITHAIVGGQKAQSFGISDDPAFFHVLSSTLYKHTHRAVIRETLCNSWDAHIEAGITSIPVEITLTDSKLIIQDFGTGIDPTQIQPIYGVYGASTKKKNKNVTGGFGLGCKSPFAYTDHFEVTSCHLGEKSVYRMSKSSGAVMGKPSILPIVSGLKTDESGITVSIPIKERTDRIKFEKLIVQIAKLGGMRIKLNGQLIEPIPFDDAKNGYLLVQVDEFGEGGNHPIQVRYGNVVYPIEAHETYNVQFRKIKEFLSSISPITQNTYRYDRNFETDWVLILQAEPDTISVTPSREALGLTDHTIETLTALLDKFIQHIRKSDMRGVCTEMVSRAIDTTWLIDKPVNLLTLAKEVPNKKGVQTLSTNYITDLVQAGGHYLQVQYPKFEGFHRKDIEMRFAALAKSGFVDRGLVQTLRAEIRRNFVSDRSRRKFNVRAKKLTPRYYSTRTNDDFYRGTKWFNRRVLYPIYKAIAETPLVDKKRLYVWDTTPRRGEKGTIEPSRYELQLSDTLPFLRKIVIISYNRMDVADRAWQFPMMKFWFGSTSKTLVYLVPRNPQRVKATVELFQKLGYHILNLTERQSWEPETVTEPVKRDTPVKKRPKGIPQILQLGSQLNLEDLYAETTIRLEKPEFVVKVSPRQERFDRFDRHFDNSCTRPIIRLWGDVGGAISSSTQEAKYMAAGAKDLKTFVFEKLLHAYKNEPLLKKYHQFSSHEDHESELDLDNHQEEILRTIQKDSVLCKEFKLPDEPPQHIKDMMVIFRSFVSWEYQHYPVLKEIAGLVKSWGVSPELKALIDQVEKAKLLRMIDRYGLGVVLSTAGSFTPAQKQIARDTLLKVLKG